MKKALLIVLLLTVFTGASLFAWAPLLLTTYPRVIANDPWQINFGFGLGIIPNYQGINYMWIPPLILHVDRNVPLGGLPFFIGGSIGYTGHGYTHQWYSNTLSLKARFGYHFNWGVNLLDTYAVVLAGADISFGSTSNGNINSFADFNYLSLFGFKIGARYFAFDRFGFYAEAGFHWFSFFNLGLTVKF